MTSQHAIYTLADPRDHQVRYVGRTLNPDKRLREHILDAHLDFSSARPWWLRQLLAAGVRPVMSIIEWCDAEIAEQREVGWIRWYAWQGLDLVNGLIPGGSTSATVKAVRRERKQDYPAWRAQQKALLAIDLPSADQAPPPAPAADREEVIEQ